MQKQSLTETIRTIRELLSIGVLDFPNLHWGLDHHLRRLFENDFSRIYDVIESLNKEIKSIQLFKVNSQSQSNYLWNSLESLLKTRSVLSFWIPLILAYYERESNGLVPERHLPNSRVIIIPDKALRYIGVQLKRHNKQLGCPIQKNVKTQKGKHIQSLEANKKSSSKLRTIKLK